MSMFKLKNLIFIISFLIVSTPVIAGSFQRNGSLVPIEDIVVLSKKVEKYAAQQRARVFFIARQGRPTDELPDGVTYTHVSYAVYSNIETDDGRTVPGYAVYNLYQLDKDPSRSQLIQDFPIDFLAGAHAAKAGIIIPRQDLQARLLAVINSDSYTKLHNPVYSAISNPYNAKYQNCTEHVLDVLNAAIYQTDDIQQLKENTRAHFEAKKLKINPVKLFLGALFFSEVRISDQNNGVYTTTFGSIVDYLQANGLVDDIAHIHL